MSFKPLGFRILVRPDKQKLEEELGEKVEGGYKTKSGFFIPEKTETVKDAERDFISQEYGTLVAVGDIAWFDYADGKHWAEIGDRVIFSKYSGTFVRDPDTKEQLILLNDSDLIGTIPKEEEKVDEAR